MAQISDPVTAYARSVVDGLVPSGKWQKLSCQRHLNDLAAENSPWQFRPELAAKAFGIIGMFRHFKGEWAGEPIRLEPFQQFIIGSLMGWVDRKTNIRRFPNAFVELPRGQGKSTLAGALLVLFSFFLAEGGAEGYSVATKKDQARISFQAGRQMMLRSKTIRKHATIGKHNLHNSATESKMEPLGADADTLDGLRPFICVVDEVHKLKSADIIDVMESGMGTRIGPLLFEITTAGLDDNSVYGQHYLLSTRVLDGTVDLPQWFAFIAAADADDDWTKEDTWKKANPNYGISVKPDFLKKECAKALANPAEQGKFRRLYLGQKVQVANSYFSLDDWKACPQLPSDDELKQLPCYMGFDLSSTTDITAAVLVWKMKDEFAVKPYFWMPEDTLEERGHQDRLPYARWAADGLIRTLPGKSLDRVQELLKPQLVQLSKTWNIVGFCADPWHMTFLGTPLVADGVPVILVPQRYEKLSTPTKMIQAKILERRIRHDHHPLMTVMVANASTREDENRNVMLSKRRSTGRIDGMQALMNAMAQVPIAPASEPQLFFLGGNNPR